MFPFIQPQARTKANTEEIRFLERQLGQQSPNELDIFMAKLTSRDSSTGWYAWTEQRMDSTGVRVTKEGGRSGTVAAMGSPARCPNNAVIDSFPFECHLRRTNLITNYGVMYEVVSDTTGPSGARVYSSVTQTVHAGAFVPLRFDTERWDVGNYFNTTYPFNDKLSISQAGYYSIGAHIWPIGLSSTETFAIALSNGIVNYAVAGTPLGGGYLTATTVWYFYASDYVSVYPTTNAVTATVQASDNGSNQWICEFWIHKLP